MQQTNVPFKVALGYIIVAIVLILAIGLVYRNTTTVLAINQATRDYIEKRQAADSTMSNLLKEEQTNLQQLTRAMQGKSSHNYLHEKMNSLNSGEDSVVVHSKAPKTHVAKNTTVEVMKTRKGFFRRLADAFKKEHAETLSIRRDSNQAVTDTLSTPVNLAGNVADILEQIDRKEKQSTRDNHDAINREVRDLQITNARLALRSSQQLNDIHQRERQAMQQAINQAMQARQNLLWQIGLLAIVAITAAVILVYYIYRDTQKERIYRENLEEANEEIRRIMNQRERLLLTITHDIKAPAASISGFIDLMKDYVDTPQGISCLNSIKGSATHLSRLVAALLDYHQLENGLMKLNPVDFSPADMFRQCAGEMQILSQEKGLELHLELDGISNPQTYYRATPIRCSHRAFWFYGSVGIYFRLEYAYIGQVTVFFIVVKAIADHKFIRDLKAAVIRLDVRHAAAGLAEDGTDPDAVGIAHFQHRDQLGQRDAGVKNILDDQQILAGQVCIKILDDLDKAG